MSTPSENKSVKLYRALLWRGYPKEFCRENYVQKKIVEHKKAVEMIE